MTKTSEVLTCAMELVDTPEKWARDAFSRPKRLCVLHAIWRASSITLDAVINDAQDWFRRAIGQPLIGVWNDDPHRTHAEIMAGFKRAIALAKEAGQ